MMLSVKDNKTALINLRFTFKALEDLDLLINLYSTDLPGPAYAEFSDGGGGTVYKVQLDRTNVVIALKTQKNKLVEYLATLGLTWDA